MALAVAGLRQRWHSQHRLDHTDRRLSESLGDKHGVATTVKDNRPDSEAKSNSQSSVLHGKLSPERVRGGEGRTGLGEGSKGSSAGHAAKRSRVSPLVSVVLVACMEPMQPVGARP